MLEKNKFGRKAFLAFIFLSLVSLFADITYEGARSVIGAYLEAIEATVIVAGVISIGELVSYLSRGLSGYIAGISRSSRTYWALVYLGYAINLVAIPIMGLFKRWEIVFLLVMIERFGKGLRAPARDVILSEVTKNIGRGKAFGFHELMDQIGAVSGPIVVAAALYFDGYLLAFLVLAVPAVLSILMLSLAYANYPKIEAIEIKREHSNKSLPKIFWDFTLATVFLSLGFASWFFLSYYFSDLGIPDRLIAVMYSIAMLSDGIVAFPAGLMYDKYGPKMLLVAPLTAIFVLPLAILGRSTNIILAVIVWGIVMGFYETVLRAFIADSVDVSVRSYAYGIYGVLYGLSWTLGNIIISLFYRYNAIIYAPIYVVIVETLAVLMFIKIAKRKKHYGETLD